MVCVGSGPWDSWPTPGSQGFKHFSRGPTIPKPPVVIYIFELVRDTYLENIGAYAIPNGFPRMCRTRRGCTFSQHFLQSCPPPCCSSQGCPQTLLPELPPTFALRVDTLGSPSSVAFPRIATHELPPKIRPCRSPSRTALQCYPPPQKCCPVIALSIAPSGFPPPKLFQKLAPGAGPPQCCLP